MSDLRKQADELIAAGKMPSLDAVLSAVAEIRAEYRPKILAARTTEQLAEKILQDVKQMSPEEKQKVREHLDKAFGKAKIVHDHDLDAETDEVLRTMLELGTPLTLENYIDLAYMGAPPDGIEEDGEFLASVPDVILNGPRLVQ